MPRRCFCLILEFLFACLDPNGQFVFPGWDWAGGVRCVCTGPVFREVEIEDDLIAVWNGQIEFSSAAVGGVVVGFIPEIEEQFSAAFFGFQGALLAVERELRLTEESAFGFRADHVDLRV